MLMRRAPHQGVVVLNLLHGRLGGQGELDHRVLIQAGLAGRAARGRQRQQGRRRSAAANVCATAAPTPVRQRPAVAACSGRAKLRRAVAPEPLCCHSGCACPPTTPAATAAELQLLPTTACHKVRRHTCTEPASPVTRLAPDAGELGVPAAHQGLGAVEHHAVAGLLRLRRGREAAAACKGGHRHSTAAQALCAVGLSLPCMQLPAMHVGCSERAWRARGAPPLRWPPARPPPPTGCSRASWRTFLKELFLTALAALAALLLSASRAGEGRRGWGGLPAGLGPSGQPADRSDMLPAPAGAPSRRDALPGPHRHACASPHLREPWRLLPAPLESAKEAGRGAGRRKAGVAQHAAAANAAVAPCGAAPSNWAAPSCPTRQGHAIPPPSRAASPCSSAQRSPCDPWPLSRCRSLHRCTAHRFQPSHHRPGARRHGPQPGRRRAAACQRQRPAQAALHHPVRLPGLRQDHAAQAHTAQQGGAQVRPAQARVCQAGRAG